MSTQPDMVKQTHSPVTPERLMQINWGYAMPLIIEAAVDERVFDLLDANGPQSVEQISEANGASARGLRAIMNALVGANLLSKDAEERYSLTPESAAFLVSSKPGFHGGMFRHVSTQLIPNWLHLLDTVRTGRPARRLNETKDASEFFEQFVADLFPVNYQGARALGEHLGVPNSSSEVRVLDIAAGSGVWGIALAQQSPQVRVTAVDFPGVLKVTRNIAQRAGVDSQMKYVPGSLYDADWGSGYQIATLGHILHSEGEKRSRGLLHKVYNALAPGGTVAIAEFLVNEDRTGTLQGLIFSVNMLVMTEEGDTFSFREIAEWLKEAGFISPRLLEAPGFSPLILATKPQ